jgi:6,7-dimethyl-8-ribityllumazine synthase
LATSGRKSVQSARNKQAGLAWKKIAILVSEWNEDITEALLEGTVKTLLDNGMNRENIIRSNVPGSFELSLGAQLYAQDKNIDAVICLGCVIRGETMHFKYICDSVAQGLKDVALKFNKPVIFGVLTTDTLQQAQDRAGGKHGNKGEDAALAVIKMLSLITNISNSKF